MPLDMKAWLKDLGLTDDKIDTVASALADPSIAANIERATMSRADYDRQAAALTTKQAELDAANTRLNEEMIAWADTRDAGGEVTEKMRQTMAAAQGEVARLHAIITSKAGELGLDAKTIIGEATPVVNSPASGATSTAQPDANAITRQDLLQMSGNLADYFLSFPAELAALQHEHQQLTGEYLDPRPLVAEIRARAQDPRNKNRDGSLIKPVDARAIWEEQQGIAAKRDAKATKDRETLIAAAEQRGYERARTETTLPGAEPTGRYSPVLKSAAKPDHSRLPDGQRRGAPVARMDRVSAAASALATHRYRNKDAGSAA